MRKHLITFIIVITLAQNAGLNAKEILYRDAIYDLKVSSILIKQTGTDERFAMLNLTGGNTLSMSFDMLESTNDYFQYTIEHCDKDWKPSGLNINDYISGNQFEQIEQFKFSSNTYKQYTHYEFLFPSGKMKPRIAGNYILKVYRNFDETDLLFTRRILIINNVLKLSGTVRSATSANFRFTHQEIDFVVEANGFSIPNPFNDLHAFIFKNYSWMHCSEMLKPQFSNSNTYTFNYEKENVINGVNEMRFFDVRGLRTFASGVKSKYFDTSKNQAAVNLFEDNNRGSITYLFWQDNNGKTVYGNRDLPNIANSEDYLLVNFSLLNSPLFDAKTEVYLLGEFNDWQIDTRYKMQKNAQGNYTLQSNLKQGYYNYLYATKGNDGKPDFSITEGMHQETENDYRVLVYHKNQFLRYDELLGFMFLNTLNANTKK